MKRIKKCSLCNQRDETVSLREDPYQADINDDHTKILICDKCELMRIDDI